MISSIGLGDICSYPISCTRQLFTDNILRKFVPTTYFLPDVICQNFCGL